MTAAAGGSDQVGTGGVLGTGAEVGAGAAGVGGKVMAGMEGYVCKGRSGAS